MEADFAGYATKAGLKCSDGLTIAPEAFMHQDKMTVPLVWQHDHSSPSNVLGQVTLESRKDGVYCKGYFNNTASGQDAKALVAHKDIDKMSIYANQLKFSNKLVVHGAIKEVSLVLAGANPGAKIDFIRIAHGDGPEDIEQLEDEAVITTGDELEIELSHAATAVADDTSTDDSDISIQDVYDAMSEQQQEVVNYLIGAALESVSGDSSVAQSDIQGTGENGAITHKDIYDNLSDDQREAVDALIGTAVEEVSLTHTDQEGHEMKHNVFEDQSRSAATLQHAAMMEARSKLDEAAIKTIMSEGERLGSLKESFLAHAGDYGIDNIDVLFPDATLDQNGVSIISRRMDWVQDVLTNTRHSPFSRVKSLAADITADEARARGYVKGNLKKDEVIKMLRRTTSPKTIYKKQKLDRDDILDITEIDIVTWLKAEMRIMLDEEVARAVLVGDNRDADDDDKIDEDCIRPVAYDIDMYTARINLAVDIAPTDLVDAVVGALDGYKGSGTPTFYTTQRSLTQMLLTKDGLGRRLYPTKADLANALLVKDIVPVEAMEQDTDLVGVIVNLADYTIGADAGGAVSMFDDFDIDFNQQKYLIETRISGALTKPKSAIALFVNSGRVVTPQTPTFVASTGVVTIPNQNGVVYTNDDTGTTLASGPQTAVAPGATLNVLAVPANGFGFTHDVDPEFSFTRNAS